MVSLSTTKVELNAAVMGAQDALIVRHIKITWVKDQITYTDQYQ